MSLDWWKPKIWQSQSLAFNSCYKLGLVPELQKQGDRGAQNYCGWPPLGASRARHMVGFFPVKLLLMKRNKPAQSWNERKGSPSEAQLAGGGEGRKGQLMDMTRWGCFGFQS